jgi:hypothetical protein
MLVVDSRCYEDRVVRACGVYASCIFEKSAGPSSSTVHVVGFAWAVGINGAGSKVENNRIARRIGKNVAFFLKIPAL